ncbi:MAG: 7-carboxy-7-deazaguanine synthase [Acetobacteraceae bacterium]|nr:7-carboxy-7-deazaguanine synthase [Acetobacteraceae bacterium]
MKGRSYSIKEIFHTLQGEGRQAGRSAVFCRFAGCNLWTGREQDRSRAVCRFCDTDFVGLDGVQGGRYVDANTLARIIEATWRGGVTGRFVVLTGGEPLLQVDLALIAALHAHHFEIAVETNGSMLPPAGLDWICVSPKAGAALQVKCGDELKLVYPQEGAEPERYASLSFAHFLLQPMDGPNRIANTRAAIAYCLDHPQWRLSLQTHKVLGIP